MDNRLTSNMTGSVVNWSYDMQSQLAVHKQMDQGADPHELSVVSYTYEGAELKRRELVNGAVIWARLGLSG